MQINCRFSLLLLSETPELLLPFSNTTTIKSIHNTIRELKRTSGVSRLSEAVFINSMRVTPSYIITISIFGTFFLILQFQSLLFILLFQSCQFFNWCCWSCGKLKYLNHGFRFFPIATFPFDFSHTIFPLYWLFPNRTIPTPTFSIASIFHVYCIYIPYSNNSLSDFSHAFFSCRYFS